MGGEIHLESEPGVGSVFSVDLRFGGPQEKRRTTDLGGIRVLHLVDHRTRELAGFLSRYVTHWNARADVVFDVEECLKRLVDAAGTPDRFHIVVIGPALSPKEQIGAREKILAIPSLGALRFVFINDDHQRAAKMTSNNTLSMTAAPLSYWGYMESIAIASGRASPDTRILAEKEVLPKVQAPSIDEAAAAGQLILVAEDNEINQDVLRRQLSRLGYAAVIVGDGLQALEAHATGRYSLLLTDCHMPLMDGYQLTTKIREREQQTGGHIPIIAITANALHGEVERCLAIGMDDFVVKPIELRAFRTKLRQWMPPRHAQQDGTASANSQTQSLAS
jgi:CheY-like chemotaxis protein